MKTTFQEIIDNDIPVLLDFSASWCGPCKAMEPILKEVAKEFKGKARVLKIDIDKNPALAGKLSVRAVPTLLLYKNGYMLWRQSGVVPANVLSKAVNDAIAQG